MRRILYYLSCAALLAFAACNDEDMPEASLSLMEVSSLQAAVGDEQVTLSWQPMQDAAPTGYYLLWTASSAAVAGGEREVESSVTSTTIADLVNGETYTFSVQAVYEGGSRSGAVTVKAKPVSSKPAPVSFTAIPGDGAATLQWTRPADNLTEYKLRVNDQAEISVNKDSTQHLVTGLTNDVEYTFALTAVYPNGSSVAAVATATPSIDPSAYLWSKVSLQQGELSGYVKVSNPVFSPDGNTIYIPTSTPKGHLFAVDRRTGAVKWVFEIATVTYGGGAVVDATGIIYQCGTDKKVYAINPDGTQKWVCSVDAVIGAFPALSANGVLYCVTNSSKLYAISTADGAVAWSKDLGTATGSAVALDASGNVYVGTSLAISKYDASGNKLWETSALNVTERGAFAMDGAGTTLYATLKAAGGLAAVNMTDGSLRWTYANEGGNDSYLPVVGADGTIYFNDKGNKKVHAISSNGTLKWATSVGAAATYCGLALANNGKVYCATQAKQGDVWKLHGLNVADGSIDFTFDSNEQFMAGVAIGADQRLYVGTIGSNNVGSLLAIPIDADLAADTWSTRGGNRQGTNRK